MELEREELRRRLVAGESLEIFTGGGMHAQDAAIPDVAKADLSLVGVVQRLADAARQMKVGGGDDDAVHSLLDLHDAVQGVFGVLLLLLMVHQVEDFLLMFLDESAAQSQKAAWVFIPHSLTGRTHVLMGWCGALHPRPAPLVIDRAAPGANHRLRKRALQLIRVMDAFVKEAVVAARSCGRPHGLLFHPLSLQAMVGIQLPSQRHLVAALVPATLPIQPG